MSANVTTGRVESVIATMDCTSPREIKDGSGMPGTWVLSDVIASVIAQWINEEDTPDHQWSDSDIVDYINETYPVIV